MIRFIPFLIVIALLGLSLWGAHSMTWLYGFAAALGGLVLIGLFDLFQTRHTLLRNFPLLGRLRGVAAQLRPFFRSYIVESQTEGRPFTHEERDMVYTRARNVRKRPTHASWSAPLAPRNPIQQVCSISPR